MERQEEAKATKALVLLLLLVGAGSAYGRYEPEDVDITFNLDEKPLSELLETLRRILINNRPRLIIAGGVYLAPKSPEPGSPPCRWIKITLVTGAARTTIAIDDGDLYVSAFQNMEGQWHCFPNFVSHFPNGQPLLFTENYTSLFRKRIELVNVPLGRPATIRATTVLAAYHPATTPQADAKVALATLMVTISEALRFKSIRRLITDNWEGQTSLTEHQATKLIVAWGEISVCLYLWEKEGIWWRGDKCRATKKAKIDGPADAVAEVDLFMRPREICINSYVY